MRNNISKSRITAISFIFFIIALTLQSLAGVFLFSPDPARAAGNQWYASPSGAGSGDGSINYPWDLQTAFFKTSVIKPGDTLWLRGGTHGNGTNKFVSTLAGTQSNPIIVRSYPGEWAKVYGMLQVKSPDVWYWGFEVTNNLVGEECVTTNAGQNYGASGSAERVKFINMVIHDCHANGIGFWRDSEGGEAYGNIIYYAGATCPPEFSGCFHGIYTQNKNLTGQTKVIADNLIFSGRNIGIQAYSSGDPNTGVANFRLEGNTVFQTGVLWGNKTDGIFVGYSHPQGIKDLVVKDNMTYDVKYNRFGMYTTGSTGFVVEGNYFSAEVYAYFLNGMVSPRVKNNTLIASDPWWLARTVSLPSGDFSGNRYEGPGNLGVHMNGEGGAGGGVTWDAWRAFYGEAGSVRTTSLPTAGPRVFVRPNKYEQGRANVTIYNWSKASSASVDLSSVLTPGTEYEIRDVQNFFGAPVVTGTYTGGSVNIPMTGTARATAIHTFTPPHTSLEFGAFVVLPKNTVTVIPSPHPASSDTIAPVISQGSPTGQQAGGTTNVTMRVYTNESATCRYSSSAGTAFSSMTIQFGTTGNTNHSTIVSNLQNGTNYSYYVKCQDLAGNTNTSDYSINFAVSAPSTPPPPPPNAVYQYYEAESGNLASPMAAVSDSGASEGKYITSPTADSGTANYGFNVTNAGAYVVWMRLLAPSISQDSVYVSMDGTSEDVFDMAENKWSQNWQWVKVNGRAGTGNPLTLNPKLFSLTASSHTLKIRGREVGSKIDKILITNDQGFVPTDGSSQPTTPPTSGDTQAPVVTIQQPVAGQVVSGTIDLKATATDNVSVISFYFLIDGVKFGSNYRLPLSGNSYVESFDSSRFVADGSHTVSARAEDEAGNVTNTPPVSFTVKNSTTTPPPTNQKPTGFLDGISSDGKVAGWAHDPNDTSRPVKIHLYFDRNAGTAGAAPMEITASEARSDVGNHAFNFTIPEAYRDNATHQVWAWAIDLTDTTGGGNVQLSGSPKTFSLAPSTTPPPPPSQTSGAAAYWTFDSSDITGSSLADKSGNNRPLALTSIGQSSGKYGQAGAFNGSNSFGSVADTSALNLVSDLTLTAWVKTTNASRVETILGKYYLGGYESGYLLRVNTDGHLGLRLGGDNLSNIYGTSNREVADTGKVVNDGQWHHVAAVIKLGQGATFYVDGAQTSNHQRAVVAASNSTALSVGRTAQKDYGYGAYFIGDMDEVKIYTSALSASDVSALYGSSSPVPPTTTPPPPTTTPPPTGQTSGYFEAESGSLTSPMAKGSDAAASGGQYVYTPTPGAGSLSLPISVTNAGNYYIWGRVQSPNYTRDSFSVAVGSGSGDIWDTAEDLWSDSWQWTRVTGRNANSGVVSLKNQDPRVFTLNAGSQTLVFQGRDANTFLDRIFITSDPSASPSQTAASPSASSPNTLTDVKSEEPAANPATVTTGSQQPKFGPGSLLKGSDPTVWLILDNGSRYSFDDSQEFFHFGYRFDLIHTVTDAELQTYPISTISALTYHAHNFVKYQNDPTIYRIEANTKLGVTSPEVLFAYADSWNEVLIIPDDLTYPTGQPLPFPDGTLIKGSGPTVYVIENGKRRALRSAEAFFNRGYNFSQVLQIQDSDLNLNSAGEEVVS